MSVETKPIEVLNRWLNHIPDGLTEELNDFVKRERNDMVESIARFIQPKYLLTKYNQEMHDLAHTIRKHFRN